MLMIMSHPVSLLYAKYFCDAVRLGSLTASAKVNFVTQSAVSQGITKLEHRLKCLLFARQPNQLRLTEDGEVAFRSLSELLNKAGHLDDLLEQANGPYMGELSFSCTHSFALGLLPPYLRRFRTEYPQVKVNFQCIGEPEQVMLELKKGNIDFGIAPKVEIPPGFEAMPLYRGAYGLYRAKGLDEGNAFILPEPEDTTAFKEAYKRAYQKEPEIFLEVGSWEVTANLVAEGLGIGYFPAYVARNKDNLIPCHQNLMLPTYEICALHLKGMTLRKSSQLFLSYFFTASEAEGNGEAETHNQRTSDGSSACR